MVRFIVFSSMIAIGLALPSFGQGRTPEGQGVVFRQHVVTDPGLQDMPAATVLVPKGWEVEGGLLRPGDAYYTTPVLTDIKFSAPDGRSLRILPSFVFEFNVKSPQEPLSATLNGNMYFPLPESPSAWIMQMHEMNPDPAVSDFEIISEEVDEEATAQLRKEIAQLSAQAAEHTRMFGESGSVHAVDAQATVLTIRYKEGGRELEEKVLMHWGASVFAFNGQVNNGQWVISKLAGIRGPVGTDYTNDPEMMTILQSIQILPDWQNEMNAYFRAVAEIRYRGERERFQQSVAAHQKRMQTLNETSDIIADGYRRRVEIRDRSQAREIDAIHDVNAYGSSSGGEVRIPTIYDHVYTDGEGNFMVGENALADPGPGWQRASPIR